MSALTNTSCRACDARIDGEAALCARGFFHHVDCLSLSEQRARWSPRDFERIALKLASPNRAPAGRVIVDQADVAHLPLFVAANEPCLL